VHLVNVAKLTTITDHMVIATGNSSRHVRSIAENLIKSMKKRGLAPIIENDEDNEWVLVDLGYIVIHIMQPKVREFYNLEKLWTTNETKETITE
jgi:ribosome-associated protein